MFYYDPVCGIRINRNKAYARLEYEDETFYLCCPKCQSEFEQDPEKYLRMAKQRSNRQHPGKGKQKGHKRP